MASAEPYNTDDMTFVAFLACKGIKHVEIKRNSEHDRDNSCVWVYDPDKTQDILDFEDKYFNNEASVEPQALMRRIGLIRQELYRFLGIKPKRVSNGG